MNPAEIAKLAAFVLGLLPAGEEAGALADIVAVALAAQYVIFERTMPRQAPYCEECGFSGGVAGHHPRCSKYDRAQRAAGDTHGFGRTT